MGGWEILQVFVGYEVEVRYNGCSGGVEFVE